MLRSRDLLTSNNDFVSDDKQYCFFSPPGPLATMEFSNLSGRRRASKRDEAPQAWQSLSFPHLALKCEGAPLGAALTSAQRSRVLVVLAKTRHVSKKRNMHMPSTSRVPGASGRKSGSGFSPFSVVKGFVRKLVSTPAEEAETPQQQRRHRRARECGVDARGLAEEDLIHVWADILNNFESRVRQRWVQALWRGGVPDSVRGRLWRRAIGNRLELTSARYKELLAWGSVEGPGGGIKHSGKVEGLACIEQDLPRTGHRQGARQRAAGLCRGSGREGRR